MMKLVLLAALVVCAVASPRQPRGADYVAAESPSNLALQLSQSRNGEYIFAYQLNDGSLHEERGTLQNAGTPQEYLRIEGRRQPCSSGSQCRNAANRMETRYTIDENGYSQEIVPIEQGLSALALASLAG